MLLLLQYVEMKKPIGSRRQTLTKGPLKQHINKLPPAKPDGKVEEDPKKSDQHRSGSHNVMAAGGVEASPTKLPPTNATNATNATTTVSSTSGSATAAATVERSLASEFAKITIESPSPQVRVMYSVLQPCNTGDSKYSWMSS